jgi:hypothetical protein
MFFLYHIIILLIPLQKLDKNFFGDFLHLRVSKLLLSLTTQLQFFYFGGVMQIIKELLLGLGLDFRIPQ